MLSFLPPAVRGAIALLLLIVNTLFWCVLLFACSLLKLLLPLRARVHRDVVAALRPGGIFLLEAYTPAQLAFRTGGPPTLDLLVTAATLREELAGLEFEIAVEREREIHEGPRHNGHSAVVQVLARRPDPSGRAQNR